MKTFNMKTCQRRLAEHYQKTAKVPTTVWSSKFQVDLEQIYTRLSWVKQEQTLAGVSQKELSHYTEIFTEKKKNGVAKRILVQGETGIGKTTFVKKLLLDWSNFEETKMPEEQEHTLRRFDLVVSVNLKEVSTCQTFKEVLSQSRVFPDDETSSIQDLHSYIGENQDKVLLVFDGYDEYRTGSKAEEKYGSRSNSPIYKIFHGSILRDCTVMVTTRSSRADELQEFADIHAEITGFNWRDRKAFMLKFLGSQTEVDGLLKLLRKRDLNDLARVPLLNLFFCLLWKEEKEKLKEGFKSKTELFQSIMKHILQHSHKRHSPYNVSQLKEADYNEILTEIGKVALEGLLRGDLLFKVGQLSEKVRGKESAIVGLLQVSESGPSVEPKEIVSFIHKSIQEYLAAWFVTYRCVPEGNLGGIEHHACTVEDCKALENVFKFVSGLSNQGAEKVFEHFSSVRTRDLPVTIADENNQTDLPLYDLTERHWRFSDLAFNCFREVNTRTELLSRFLDCFGEIVPVPNHVLRSQIMPNVKDVSTLAHFRTFAFHFWMESPIPHKLLEQFIKCFHIPRTTQISEVHRVGDFLGKFLIISEHERNPIIEPYEAFGFGCSLHFILRFSVDQFQCYITDLYLNCYGHAGLFTETAEIPVLFNLRSLECPSIFSHKVMKSLGGAIRDCKQLRFIEITTVEDSVCDLLEQVPDPSKCSLKLGSEGYGRGLDGHLTSAGAVKLSNLLPRFNNISDLNLGFVNAEIDALITSITHKSLKRLSLHGMILTPAAAAALGRSLPEMSSLEKLDLAAKWNRGSFQTVDMEALFGRFNRTLPLYHLYLSGLNGYLAPLTKSFRFFPNLRELYLGELNMNEQNVCDLLEGLRFIPNVRFVSVQGKNLGRAHLSTANQNTVAGVKHENLESLTLKGISLNPVTAAALGRSLPKMSSLEALVLTGIDGNILQAEVMELLFGGFNKTMPLKRLSLVGFSVKGCLTPLTNSLYFFSKLIVLRLVEVIINDQDLSGLLESLRFLPNLEILCVECKGLAPLDSGAAEVSKEHRVLPLNCKQLRLKGISLRPSFAAALGQSLPKMSSLEILELTGIDGNILQAEIMELLFGGFNKTMPLKRLSFIGFSVKGCLTPLTNSLRFFSKLRVLRLEEVIINDQDLSGLLESLRFLPNLETLCMESKGLSPSGSSKHVNTLYSVSPTLRLKGISLTPTIAAMLGQSAPKMSSLRKLELTGLDGSVVPAEQMERLFDGFTEKSPVETLNFSGFCVRGCLASLTRSFSSFPNLTDLSLKNLNMDEHDLRGLLESFRFIPNLKVLDLSGNPLGHAATSIVRHVINLPKLRILRLNGTCSEEDLNTVRQVLRHHGVLVFSMPGTHR